MNSPDCKLSILFCQYNNIDILTFLSRIKFLVKSLPFLYRKVGRCALHVCD